MPNFSTFTWISIFALSAMVVNSLGIWFIYKHREWAEKIKRVFHVLCRRDFDYIALDYGVSLKLYRRIRTPDWLR